jgi:hypothetical protein
MNTDRVVRDQPCLLFTVCRVPIKHQTRVLYLLGFFNIRSVVFNFSIRKNKKKKKEEILASIIEELKQ